MWGACERDRRDPVLGDLGVGFGQVAGFDRVVVVVCPVVPPRLSGCGVVDEVGRVVDEVGVEVSGGGHKESIPAVDEIPTSET